MMFHVNDGSLIFEIGSQALFNLYLLLLFFASIIASNGFSGFAFWASAADSPNKVISERSTRLYEKVLSYS